MHEFHAWIGLAESTEESDLGGSPKRWVNCRSWLPTPSGTTPFRGLEPERAVLPEG